MEQWDLESKLFAELNWGRRFDSAKLVLVNRPVEFERVDNCVIR
jgi:hypothetical protein